MNQRFRCRLSLGIVFLLSFSLFLFACRNDVGAGPVAPDFILKDVTGKDHTLKQYRGNVVLLDFWATWCPPCRAAIPELIGLQDKYKKKGLVVLGISMDDPKRVSDKYLQAFGGKFKINYTMLRYDIDIVSKYFGHNTPSLPTMYVIDREGQVKDRIIGFNSNVLKKSIEGLF